MTGEQKVLLVVVSLFVIVAIVGGLIILPHFVRVFDYTPPKISGISVSDVTNSSAKIIWATDELANSTVYYGKYESDVEKYPSEEPIFEVGNVTNISFRTDHMAVIGDLEPLREYYFKIVAWDKSGNKAESDTYNFKTKPLILPLGVKVKLGEVEVVFTTMWTTKETALRYEFTKGWWSSHHVKADEGYKLVVVNITERNIGIEEVTSFSFVGIKEMKVDKGYLYDPKASWYLMTLRPEEEKQGWIVYEILEDTNPIEIHICRTFEGDPFIILKLT